MRLLMLILLITACSSKNIPVDPTPVWSQSNRYAVEMENDCNLSTHSVGLSGCLFVVGKVSGNLRFPALYSGNIHMTSTNCKNVATPATTSQDNVLQNVDIYNAPNNLTCSWEIDRVISENGMTMDNPMKGRYMIKIIQSSPYLSALKLSIGRDNFSGVAWYQKKTDSYEDTLTDAVLRISPVSTAGTFRAFCDDKLVLEQDYTTTPFDVALNSDISCDYELSTTSKSFPTRVETAAYLHEVLYRTIDITPPGMSIKKKNITATFTDKAADNRTPVVVGVKLDTNKPCINTASCSAIHNKDLYTIRALTPNGRFFYGKWRVSKSAWEVIK